MVHYGPQTDAFLLMISRNDLNGLKKLALASIAYAVLIRLKEAERAVYGCLILASVIWLCACVR